MDLSLDDAETAFLRDVLASTDRALTKIVMGCSLEETAWPAPHIRVAGPDPNIEAEQDVFQSPKGPTISIAPLDEPGLSREVTLTDGINIRASPGKPLAAEPSLGLRRVQQLTPSEAYALVHDPCQPHPSTPPHKSLTTRNSPLFKLRAHSPSQPVPRPSRIYSGKGSINHNGSSISGEDAEPPHPKTHAATSPGIMTLASSPPAGIFPVPRPATAGNRTPNDATPCALPGAISVGNIIGSDVDSTNRIHCRVNHNTRHTATSKISGPPVCRTHPASQRSTLSVTPPEAASTASAPSRFARVLIQRISQLEAALQQLMKPAAADNAADDNNPAPPITAAGSEPSPGISCKDAPTTCGCVVLRNGPQPLPPNSTGARWPRVVSTLADTSLQSLVTASSSSSSTSIPSFSSQQMTVYDVAEQLCREYNASGVVLMESELYEAAREQLEKALLLAGQGGLLEGRRGTQREMQILAHNNLACYYRKLRQPARALQHLEQTAQLETEALVAVASETMAEQDAASKTARNSNTPETSANRTGEPAGPVTLAAPSPTAATLLNLAAVSGSMGRHGQALTYASQAVVAAGRELQVSLPVLEAALQRRVPQVQLREDMPQLRGPAGAEGAMQLAAAYYNRAVEQEHLRQWQSAMLSYLMALDLASRFAGRAAELTLTLQSSAQAFKARLQKLERQGKLREAVHRPCSQETFPPKTDNGTTSTNPGACTGPGPSPLFFPSRQPTLRRPQSRALRCPSAVSTMLSGLTTSTTTPPPAPCRITMYGRSSSMPTPSESRPLLHQAPASDLPVAPGRVPKPSTSTKTTVAAAATPPQARTARTFSASSAELLCHLAPSSVPREEDHGLPLSTSARPLGAAGSGAAAAQALSRPPGGPPLARATCAPPPLPVSATVCFSHERNASCAPPVVTSRPTENSDAVHVVAVIADRSGALRLRDVEDTGRNENRYGGDEAGSVGKESAGWRPQRCRLTMYCRAGEDTAEYESLAVAIAELKAAQDEAAALEGGGMGASGQEVATQELEGQAQAECAPWLLSQDATNHGLVWGDGIGRRQSPVGTSGSGTMLAPKRNGVVV